MFLMICHNTLIPTKKIKNTIKDESFKEQLDEHADHFTHYKQRKSKASSSLYYGTAIWKIKYKNYCSVYKGASNITYLRYVVIPRWTNNNASKSYPDYSIFQVFVHTISMTSINSVESSSKIQTTFR